VNSRPITTLVPVAADRRTRLHGSVVVDGKTGQRPEGLCSTLEAATSEHRPHGHGAANQGSIGDTSSCIELAACCPTANGSSWGSDLVATAVQILLVDHAEPSRTAWDETAPLGDDRGSGVRMVAGSLAKDPARCEAQ
jgi:hypothetical protein